MKTRKHNKRNTSGYPGVSFQKNAGKYAAKLQINKRQVYLGLYSSPEKAYAAIQEHKQQLKETTL